MLADVLLPVLDAAPDPVSWLVNYGATGVVLALLAIGRFRTKQEVDGLTRQLEEALADCRLKDAAMSALIAQITQHTLPQVAGIVDVLDRMPKHHESALADQLTHLSEKLDQIERRSGGR